MDIKDSYLHGTVGVVKSISVNEDKLIYNLADVGNTAKTVTLPLATTSANGLLSSTDKAKLDASTGVSQAIPYIVGPDTDTTKGTWTGSYSGITAYTDGLTIIYVPKVDGASTTTLNINGLGAKTCYYTGTSKLTTHYTVGTPILFTYSGGAWKRADYVDGNTYTSAWCVTDASTAAKTATCSNYNLKEKSYIHVLIRHTNTVAGNITLNINNTGAKPIYINGKASSSSNYTLPAGTYIVYYDGTNFYFRTDGILPGKIEKAQLSDLVTCTAGSSDVYRPIVVYTSDTEKVYHNAKITANYVSGDLKATSFTGALKGTADKVANNLILKINSGATEGTSLYTYNGSSAKTLDIKNGTGIGFTNTAGVLSIYNSGVRSISTGSANGTISVNTNGTSANVAVKGLGSAAYTDSTGYAVRKTLTTEDLNTITTPGFYNSGGGNSCTNKPEGIDYFGMYVVHCAGGSYYVQILFADSNSDKLWRRHCKAGTWSAWTLDELIDTKVTQTNTTTNSFYRVLLSGNANDDTETTTSKKSAKLKFNPYSGVLTADIIITKGLKNPLTNTNIYNMINPHQNALTYNNYYFTAFENETGITARDNANGILWVGTHSPGAGNTSDIGYGHMLGFVGGSGALYHKIVVNGDTTKAWKQIAYTSSDITGNAASADKLKTKITLWGLDFDGSANVSGSLTGVSSISMDGDIVINDGLNNDRFIKFQYNNTDTYAWRLGYTGSQPNVNNDFVIQTTGADGKNTEFSNVLQLKPNTKNAIFSASVTATNFIGNLDGKYINKLTDYTKPTSTSAIIATDSLNTALGKLEYKADWACNWITSVTADDTDTLVNKWGEIVNFLDSVTEGTDILDEFVTRKTDLTITGKKTFDNEIIIKQKDFSRWSKIITYTPTGVENAETHIIGNSWTHKLKLWDSYADGCNYAELSGGYTNEALLKLTEFSENKTTATTKCYTKIGTRTSVFSGTVTATKFIGPLEGNADTASKLGTVNKGSTIKPIYLSEGTPTEGSKYAGGTAVTLNGISKATTTASFYAPTGGGNSGQILVSKGNGSAPVWSNMSLPYSSGHNLGDNANANSWYLLAELTRPSEGLNITCDALFYLTDSYQRCNYGLLRVDVRIEANSGTVTRINPVWLVNKGFDSNTVVVTYKYVANSETYIRLYVQSANHNWYAIRCIKISDGGFDREYNLWKLLSLRFTSIPSDETIYASTNAVLNNSLANSLTFTAGTFATKTYNGSAAVTVNVPTKTSHLTNDSGYLTSRGYIGTTAVKETSAALALTGITDLTIFAANNDRYILFDSNNSLKNSWRIGYLGSGNGDNKYLTFESSQNTGTFVKALQISNINLTSIFGGDILPATNDKKSLGSSSLTWANVYATTFTGNLTGNVTGNVSGSSGSCTGNAATATTLKSITVVSKTFSLDNTAWIDTGYTFADLATGTYAIQVTSGTDLVASGIMSVYKNLSDTVGDEIPLHVYGTAGWRPYLRTHQNILEISSNDTSVESRTVTIKIAQIL